MEQPELSKLEDRLQYEFKDNRLLHEAVCHSSFVNEQPEADLRDNERLEFLGDAVLGLMVGHLLMRRYPDINEGDLSRLRSSLVNESQLAILASNIRLGNYLLLGKGEIIAKGWEKKSILANAFEALCAAIYLDAGFDTAYNIVAAYFSALLDASTDVTAGNDYKSRLQERVQETQKPVPSYQVLSESGPDHDKTFRVQVTFNQQQAKGEGKSKKIAEQAAAQKALESLFKE